MMADEEQIVALVESHKERFGRLDVLVNNAGVGIGEAMHEITAKKLDIQLDDEPARADPLHARGAADAEARRAPSTARR